jgi:hypothetical protein
MIRLTMQEAALAAVIAVLLAINSGCGAALRTTTIAPRPTPWCLAMESRVGEAAVLCVQTEATCQRSATAAKRYGSLGGIAKVDECVYEGTEQP